MAVPTYYARLTYNANGGSGAPGAQTLSTGMPSEGIAFTISSTRPSRAAYVFKGWSFSSSASSPSYYPGGSITLAASATDGGIQSYTLYAVWEHATAYVYYNANGGSGAPSTQSHWAGYSVTLSTTTPARTGYRFLGWADSSTATSAAYQPGGKYALYSTVTLYAVWERLTYTVSYNANGGSGAPSAQTKTYDVTLTLSSTIPTRSQYEFLGWSTSNTATTATYAAGGSFTTNANTTLYAVWKLVSVSLTLTYSANGGSGAPTAETKSGVPPLSFTVKSGTPTRSGYRFLGWADSATATSVKYQAGASISMSANKTIYAVWEKTYAVTYNVNGGSGSVASQTKIKDVTLTLAGTEPTRSGYAFYGWATNASALDAEYQFGDSYTANAGLALYAVWRKLYTITYDANGGSNAPAPQTKTQLIDLVLSSSIPTLASKTFMIWQDASGNTYHPGETYTADADLSMTAVWNNFNVSPCYVVKNSVAKQVDVYVVKNGVAVPHDVYV